jgi:CheY-like chemotaxis protein
MSIAGGTLGVLLELHRAAVKTAGSVKEALGVVAVFKPNVVVSDFHFPEQSGCRLIRQMREAGWTVWAIAVTAYVKPEVERMCLEAGFEEVLWKPVEPRILLHRIARLTGGARH